MRFIKYFFLIVILVIGVTFALLNGDAVHVNFYWAIYKLPLSLLLVLTLISGALLGFIMGLGLYFRQRSISARLRKQIRIEEKQHVISV